MKLIGIDLGHGETSAYYTDLDIKDKRRSSRPLNIIPLTDKIYSAYYEEGNQVKLISPKSPEADIIRALGSGNFRQSFKGCPTSKYTIEEDLTAMGIFAREVYKNILSTNEHISPTDKVYVACPTSWSKEDAEAYLDIINLAGVPAEWIISEAFASLVQHGRTISISKNVLIIDYGSSTVDYVAFKMTNIKEFDIVCKGAYSNGAHHVEVALANDENVASKYKGLNPDIPSLEFAARIGKEHHYSKPKNYLKISLHPDYFIPAATDCVEIQIETNNDLANILSDYKQRIERDFSRLKDNLLKRGFTPDIVIFTGSASAMDFAENAARSIFPVQFQKDPLPEFVICSGIVEYARMVVLGDTLDQTEIIAHRNIYRALCNRFNQNPNIDFYLSELDSMLHPEAKLVRAICYWYGIGHNNSPSPNKAFELIYGIKDQLDECGKLVLAYMLYQGMGKLEEAGELLKNITLPYNQHLKVLADVVNENASEECSLLVEEDNFLFELIPSSACYLKQLLRELGLDSVSTDYADGITVPAVSEKWYI